MVAVVAAPWWALTSVPCIGCSITKRRHHRQRTPGLVPATSQAMKTEKDEPLPPFSLGGKYAGEGAGESLRRRKAFALAAVGVPFAATPRGGGQL